MLKRSLLIISIIVSFSYPVTVQFTCSLPALNWLYLESEGDKQSELGGWLLGIGYEWVCPKILYFSLNADLLTSYWLPVLPEGMTSNNDLTEMCVSAQVGMHFNRVSFGVGPLYGVMNHIEKATDPVYYNGYHVSNSAEFVGFNLSGEYQLKKRFYLGLNYRPNFYNLSYEKYDYPSKTFYNKSGYSHSLSLSLTLKLARRE